MDSSFSQEQDITKEAEQGDGNDAGSNVTKIVLGPSSAFSSCRVTLQQGLSPRKFTSLFVKDGLHASPQPHFISLLDGSPNQNKIKHLKLFLNCKMSYKLRKGSQFKNHWRIPFLKALKKKTNIYRFLVNYDNEIEKKKCGLIVTSAITSSPNAELIRQWG